MPESIIQVQSAPQTVLSINSNPTSGLFIGVMGPAGPQGPIGPQGPAGTGAITAYVISLSAGTGISLNAATGNVTVTNTLSLAGLESATATLNNHLTGTDSGTASNANRIGSLETTTGTFNTRLSGLESATSSLNTRVGSLESATGGLNTRVSGLESATGNLNTRTTGLESATGTLNTKVSGLESATSNIQTQVGSLWNSKVPYTGASANVNLAAFSLTAASISSGGGISGTTVSAGTLLAGNFQSTTASFNSRLSGLESGTGTLASGTASNASRISGLETATGNLSSRITGITGSNIGGGTSLFIHKVADELRFRSISGAGGVTITQSGSGIEISSTTASGEANTASNTGTGTGLYRQKTGVNFEFKSLSAGANIGITDLGTSISISSAAGGGGGVPPGYVTYSGATADLNLAAYALTASSISSGGGISGTTLSAVTLLAGNFQSSTAGLASNTATLASAVSALQTRALGLESGTGALASGTSNNASRITTLESVTGGLQTQIGSLWNSKVPYTGASANVNLAAYALTASSISSGGGITGTTISGTTILAGNFQSTTASFNTRLSGLESGTAANAAGTGALQTQVGSLWNSKVPYSGASANVNLASNSLTAGNISAMSISVGQINSSYIAWSGNKQKALMMGNDVTQENESVVTGANNFNVGLYARGLFPDTLGTGVTSNGAIGGYLSIDQRSNFTVTGDIIAAVNSITFWNSTSATTRAIGTRVDVGTGLLGTASVLTGIGVWVQPLARANMTTPIAIWQEGTSDKNILAGLTQANALTATSVSATTVTSNAVSALTLSSGTHRVGTLVFGDGTTMNTAATGTGSSGGSFTGGQVASAYWVNLLNSGTALGSGITANFNTSNVIRFAVTGSTSATLVSGSAGGRYLLIISQGPTTGGVVFGPAASIKWAGGTAPTLSPSANTTDLVAFAYDGTYYHGTYTSSNTAANVTYNAYSVLSGGSSALVFALNNTSGSGTEVAQIENELLFKIQPSDPPIPSNSGYVGLYADNVASKTWLAYQTSRGVEQYLQTALWSDAIFYAYPANAGAVGAQFMQFIGGTGSSTGTMSVPLVNGLSGYLGTTRRAKYINALGVGTAPTWAGLSGLQPMVWRGASANTGSFFFHIRFAVSGTNHPTSSTGTQMFIGLTTSGGPLFTNTASAQAGAGLNQSAIGLTIDRDNVSSTPINFYTACPTGRTVFSMHSEFLRGPTASTMNETSCNVYDFFMLSPVNGSFIGAELRQVLPVERSLTAFELPDGSYPLPSASAFLAPVALVAGVSGGAGFAKNNSISIQKIYLSSDN